MTAQRIYTDGNTVRKERIPNGADPRRDLLQQAEAQEKRARARVRAQENRMGFIYVLFLTVAAVALVVVCYQFMKTQATMNKSVKEISSLKVELEDLRSENDYNLARINESIDLDDIREKALNLGMHEATSSQIVTYSYTDSDYLRQYAQVTDDGESASVLDYFSD